MSVRPSIKQLKNQVKDGDLNAVYSSIKVINNHIKQDKNSELKRSILRLTEAAERITKIYKDGYKEPDEFFDAEEFSGEWNLDEKRDTED